MLTAVPTTVWLFGSRFPRRDSEIFVLRSSSDLLDSVEHLRRRLMTSLRRFSDPSYSALVKDLGGLLESARRATLGLAFEGKL